MNASFGPDRQRCKPCLLANFIGDELINRHIAIAAVLRFMMKHARQKSMHREVPTTNPVIEASVNVDVLTVFRQRFQKRCLFKFTSGRFGKEMLLLKAKQI